MLPVKRMSGKGITPPLGVQNGEVAFEGHTTMRAKPTEFGPIVTVEEVCWGFVHEGELSGEAWIESALAGEQGWKAGTSETLVGEAPTGLGYDGFTGCQSGSTPYVPMNVFPLPSAFITRMRLAVAPRGTSCR